MKIKTITCHEVYNYGASLQEYALLRYLQNLGHEAETIHYKPPHLSGHFKLWVVSNEFFARNIFMRAIYLTLKLPKRIINLKRKRNFDKFSEKHIKSTQKLYRSNNELKADTPEADVYICGSDQIWNSFFENGKDPAFYLDFVPDNKLKLSYAASFAIDKLEDNIKDFVKEKIGRLDHVSVRESSGKRIVEDLGYTNVTQVLDPVFLIDSQEWKSLMIPELEKDLISKGKYIVVYDFDNDPSIKYIAETYKEKGYKIYAFNELIDYASENFYLEGVEFFLTVLNGAEAILANSFHAVAFSFIFHKKLGVFNRNDKINTRMRDLLQSVDLIHLLIDDKKKADNFKFDAIDYKEVQSKLDVLIEKSKNYLDKALTK